MAERTAAEQAAYEQGVADERKRIVEGIVRARRTRLDEHRTGWMAAAQALAALLDFVEGRTRG